MPVPGFAFSRFVLLVALLAGLPAQDPPPDPPPGRAGMRNPGGPGGPGGMGGADLALVSRFDADKNGWLNAEERAAARAHALETRRNQRGRRGGGPPGFGPPGSGAPGPGGMRGGPPGMARGPVDVPEPAVVVERDAVPQFPGRDLYDEEIVRTFFFTIPTEGWKEEMVDFHRTDVEVPATLWVDGEEYHDVGISYRGNTSFMMVPEGQRRPLGVSLDLADKAQRLLGYKSLNLLNAHTDPSLQRELTYLRICRDYVPAPRANFVRVVINGEDWGVHVNVQQMNKDFLAERFGSRKGIRYKSPANFSGEGGLADLGDDPEAYARVYELLSEDAKAPWAPLIDLCKLLAHASDAELVEKLPGMLEVDEALWFLALDNVFMDDDGYVTRASDYMLFCDDTGRFLLLPHDSNETFRWGGMAGRGGRRGGPGAGQGPPGDTGARRGGPPPGATGPTRDLLAGSADERRPLARRLLSIPAWRAAYVAHVRTLLDEWLRWDVLEPTLRAHHARLDPFLRVDHHQLYGYAAFQASLEAPPPEPGETPVSRPSPSLREFVDGRRRFLLQHVALQGPTPRLANAVIDTVPANGNRQRVRARVTVQAEGSAATAAWLHVRHDRYGPDRAFALSDDGQHGDGVAGDGVFGGESESIKEGRTVFAWIAVYAGEGEQMRAAFEPAAGGGSPQTLLLRKR